MRVSPCPECNATEIYYGKVMESDGGLRDEHKVYIPTNDSLLYFDTSICLVCGNVRLHLDEKSKKLAATELLQDKGWTKVS